MKKIFSISILSFALLLSGCDKKVAPSETKVSETKNEVAKDATTTENTQTNTTKEKKASCSTEKTEGAGCSADKNSKLTLNEANVTELGFEKSELKDVSLSLITSSDSTLTLDTFKGRYVFVTFFATWCPHCQKELPIIDKMADMLKSNEDIVFINIAVDRDEEAKEEGTTVFGLIDAFKKQYDIKNVMMVRENPDRTSMKSFNVTGVPSIFLLSPEGKVIGHRGGEFDWMSKSEDFKKYFK